MNSENEFEADLPLMPPRPRAARHRAGLLGGWVGGLVLTMCGPTLGCGSKEDEGPVVETPAAPPGPPVSASPVKDRLVVLVVPGLDPDLVGRWRADLPNLDRMGPSRSLALLANDLPLSPEHLYTQLALSRKGGAGGVPGLDARVGGEPALTEPFWVQAARAGIPTRAIWAPGELPQADVSGLWVLPQGLAPASELTHWSILTPGAEAAAAPPGSALHLLEGAPPWQISLPMKGGGSLELELSSPREGLWRLSASPLHLDLSRGELAEPVRMTLAGGSGGEVLTRWAVNPMGAGVAISLVASGRGETAGSAVTAPASLAQEWAGFHGPVDTTGGTVGLVEAYQDGWISTEALSEELTGEFGRHSAIVQAELQRQDARLVVAWLPQLGIAAQAFVGLSDSQHPAWDGELAARYGGMMKSMATSLDTVVGQLRSSLNPGDRILVVSDHAVASQRFAVDLNAVLVDAGLLVLKPELERLSSRELDDAATWSRTTAFAASGTAIYLNQAGRQASGSVPPAKRARELARVRAAVAGLRHQGRPVVAEILDGAVALPGLPEPLRPDLVVSFADGYGPSGGALRDRVGLTAVVPGTGRLTGGAPSAASRRAGMVFASNGAADSGAHLADLGPTVWRLLGLPDREGLEGAAWAIAGPAITAPPPEPVLPGVAGELPGARGEAPSAPEAPAGGAPSAPEAPAGGAPTTP